jgi:integrase/recombinase XerD
VTQKSVKMVYREFTLEIERLGYSLSARKQIASALREFLGWLDDRRITAETIQAYYEYLCQRPNKRTAGGLSSKTIHGHLYGLRLYCSFLEERGYLMSHPMSSLHFPRPESQPMEILTKAEVARLYQAATQFKVRDCLRAKAFLGAFYGCGLRRREAETLNLVDVQFKSGVLYVRKGKGQKRRAIPMGAKVITDMKTYVREARGLYGSSQYQDAIAFFRHKRGGRMRGQSFDRLLKELLQKARIEKPISLHCLRHSIATHLLAEGVPLESVRDFLGHAHLETTQIYTRIQ